MYYAEGSIHIEDEDQCINCKNFRQKVACPLIEALGLGFVYLEDSLTVTNCGFYEEYKNPLKIVK